MLDDFYRDIPLDSHWESCPLIPSGALELSGRAVHKDFFLKGPMAHICVYCCMIFALLARERNSIPTYTTTAAAATTPTTITETTAYTTLTTTSTILIY